jgi:hypothetical protein
MQSIKSIISEYLYETLYEADVVCRSDRTKNITKVTDNMRGVCGITVVTVTGPAEPVGRSIEKTHLKVKFFQIEPTLKQHLRRMSNDARKIDGVFSFIPYRVEKVRNRIYRK